MTRPYYPVALDLLDKPVLVVGGGTIAEGKVEGLLQAGALVTVVSPTLRMCDKKKAEPEKEAARRLSAGVDPGIIPERFVIGAARFALEHRLARPGVITTNFYKTLASG